MKKIDNPDKFIEYLEEKEITNLLIGNGFSLSHPYLGKNFIFDAEDFKEYRKENCTKEITCPEEFLNQVPAEKKEEFTKAVINRYIEKLEGKEKSWYGNVIGMLSILNCIDFLKLFHNVFTLNYDPLTYVSFGNPP